MRQYIIKYIEKHCSIDNDYDDVIHTLNDGVDCCLHIHKEKLKCLFKNTPSLLLLLDSISWGYLDGSNAGKSIKAIGKHIKEHKLYE